MDLVSISRVGRLLSKVSTLERNLLSLREREFSIRSKAGSVAAKEAMIKAGIFKGFKNFNKIEICRGLDGAPSVVVDKDLMNSARDGNIDIRISISYVDDIVVAIVVYQKTCS